MCLVFLVLVACQTTTTVETKFAENVSNSSEIVPPVVPLHELVSPPPRVEVLYPDEVYFWVNDILVPQSSLYNGTSFIEIRSDQIRTFAGSFGPYFDDAPNLTVVLCAELAKAKAPVACEEVDTVYRDNYVTFVQGYGPGEFIGGRVYKDYTAYYNVSVGDVQVAASNKAVIQTTS